MDSENTFYKTAELVRDTLGCYYFVCLQCNKTFENLDDTVDHIEKYFYESPDNDLLTPIDTSPMTINESETKLNNSEWMDDVDTVVANIKKESFEEYEDYKISIPEMCQDENESATNFSVYCPICTTTLSCNENSLASHLIKVHHRSARHAKIYECKICGKNTFTRSYDLERHRLIHARYPEAMHGSTSNVSETLKSESDDTVQSALFDILGQCDKESVSETFNDFEKNQSSESSSVGSARSVNKRKIFVKNLDIKPTEKVKKIRDYVDKNKNHSIKANIPAFCSICQASCSRNESLESHLIRVHRRHKQYAKVYECTICGKNTFTRPYDLRRHELIHIRQNATLTDKVDAQHTNDKMIIDQVPSINNTAVIDETPKMSTEIQTTNPKKNGILCAVCNEKFDSYLDVTMHLKNAHNQKRIYKCRHINCGNDSFTSSFALHRHEISHSLHYRNIAINNQHRMKCVFCRRTFNKKWNLMKHEKRHLVEQSQQ